MPVPACLKKYKKITFLSTVLYFSFPPEEAEFLLLKARGLFAQRAGEAISRHRQCCCEQLWQLGIARPSSRWSAGLPTQAANRECSVNTKNTQFLSAVQIWSLFVV